MPIREATAQGQLTPFVNGYLNHLQRNMSTVRLFPVKIRFNAGFNLLSVSQILVNAAILTQEFV